MPVLVMAEAAVSEAVLALASAGVAVMEEASAGADIILHREDGMAPLMPRLTEVPTP